MSEPGWIFYPSPPHFRPAEDTRCTSYKVVRPSPSPFCSSACVEAVGHLHRIPGHGLALVYVVPDDRDLFVDMIALVAGVIEALALLLLTPEEYAFCRTTALAREEGIVPALIDAASTARTWGGFVCSWGHRFAPGDEELLREVHRAAHAAQRDRR